MVDDDLVQEPIVFLEAPSSSIMPVGMNRGSRHKRTQPAKASQSSRYSREYRNFA